MNSSDATPATLLGLLSSIPANQTAIIHADQNIRVTYGELRRQVESVAEALAASGVGRGDRVGMALPNGLPTIVAFLAVASLGAIWSSCSPDFGERGILDRFGQIAPKLLITCDGYYYAGKTIRMAASTVNVVSHPLVQHKLSLMRERDRSIKSFRELLNEIGMLLCYEVTRDLPLELVEIETPLMPMKAPMIAGKKLTLAPILRAGVGFLDGMLALVPSARVAHIGLYRNPETLEAVEYYFKAPQDLSDRTVVLMDPMLATGNSACAAAALLKTRGARDIRFVCLLAAPEGIAHFQMQHPDVPVWTAAVDDKLNDHGYILPGLGDAGDRMFGTK